MALNYDAWKRERDAKLPGVYRDGALVTPGVEKTFAGEMDQTRMEAPFRPQEETVGEWQSEVAMRQADERARREQTARRQVPTDEFGTAMDAQYFQDLSRARATPAPSTPSSSGAPRAQGLTPQ